MRHFIVVSPAMLFGTSNNPMCHIFLILSYVYIFLSVSYLSLILFSSCVSSITVSPAMPSTTSNTSSQTPSVNGWYSNNQTKQHLPWSVNVSTLLPPCCPPAASHFPHYPLNTCRLPPNAGVGHRRKTPGQSSGFDQCTAHCLNKIYKVSILCFNWLNTIFAAPRQQLSEMANGMATVMANGNGNCNGRRWRRWQWPMARATVTAMADSDAKEMAAAMVDSNRNGNGWRQWQRWWALATAMATESAMATEMATAMAMVTATVRATITKEGLPLHVAAMCSAFEGRHLASTPTDTNEVHASWGWHC